MDLILTEIKNKVGFITLNSEKTLNSLSFPMIEQLGAVLKMWELSDEVVCIFLQGAGEKAFCAGGDVKKLHDAIVEQREIDPKKVPQECLDFFSKEYKVDYAIHTCPKPVIVWGSGIVMGGGIGLMVGASHRIVTEKSKLAMPEITIGFYPDVGGTWFLNRMPSAYGLYSGLTGARLDGADCRFLGLADYYIESDSKEDLVKALEQADWSGERYKTVSEVLEKFSACTKMPESKAAARELFIRKFEGVSTLKEFSDILTTYHGKDEWVDAGIKTFASGSPSSAGIIFRQLKLGVKLSLEDVFRSELNLSCQCCIHPDFVEGVRALLVDKDQSPKWSPRTQDEVTEEWIDSYFSPVWNIDKHPLKNLSLS
ncbi:enoyl-CoA hydratase [Elizabethkingia anophelis]|uniref:enoyl-CoA hydratase/isomerase family protein n=1 Tax=Elizabethkingia anophelis TaxID=1117645 RepID=UPI000CE9680E|nr:enoyl-CoA hydratase/isomerase family protein [Elizabethkingia anophelis]AVF48273.1 enoyl-CoA hydratase/isomerase family protein [Elizabethkingia anophelis]AVF52267.1 enoyl-CoA hydratase/isomerase family protein [Elizabethkingia anophelis]MBG0505905.1 enoyl-CoA hydratase/isomerase family protein [Elizabethkingia anophelis]MDV3901252.1 enoyl-CoA hydratase [Elizabethkingia anophelis]MDV4058370.1 enoyl-CoA hydratase [Elizabethkingia anophelis]